MFLRYVVEAPIELLVERLQKGCDDFARQRMIVAEDPGPEADLVIVGLLLTYVEFRSHQAYARRQYQCLTPDEVQRVGGAQRETTGVPGLCFVPPAGGRAGKIEPPRERTPPKTRPSSSEDRGVPRQEREGDTGRSAGQRGRAKDNNDS